MESCASPPGWMGETPSLHRRALEPEGWAETYAQVVACPVLEVNIVTRFQPQAHRSQKPFHAAARVDGKLSVAITDRAQSTPESHWRILTGRSEANKPGFGSNEDPHGSGTSLELGAEQAMQNVRFRRNYGTIIKRVAETAIEVVRHFPFDLNIGVKIERQPSSDTREIKAGIGAVQSEVIREGTHLNVVAACFQALGK